ncbi:serine/threonine-protein phosphatase 2A 55 kDa regulatory subunit B beta isoform-like, partial [Oncorhynchus kisutch]|uniref:serine/threonine-protein phosphatase 2A 55 kDa regulatory subunit B beta isoform-like n=1 Tax=Oncorhynchus kisutch TaxID=8019 RepID=UPI0012DCCB69
CVYAVCVCTLCVYAACVCVCVCVCVLCILRENSKPRAILRENSKPRAILKPRKVCVGGKRRKDEVTVDSLDVSKKILHSTWHPQENIIAVAASNNLYIFQDKVT